MKHTTIGLSVLFLAAVLSTAAVAEARRPLEKALKTSNSFRTSNYSQYCSASSRQMCQNANSSCCPGQGSEPSAVCCDHQSESCCFHHGTKYPGVCCIQELTFCCQPVEQHPSRCCPRWNECCEFGRYGCCNRVTKRAAEESEAYALFLQPTWISNMIFTATTIDLISGKHTDKKVNGGSPPFKSWGETQRMFMFSESRNVFYLLQANFDVWPRPTGDDPKRVIHFFTIDARTGATTTTVVDGANDEVTGYHLLDGTNTIVFSTFLYSDSKKEAPIGFTYYHLDVLTGKATQVSIDRRRVKGNISENEGFFHETSADGKHVFRLGYENVYASENYGVGVTDISQPEAKTIWVPLQFPILHNRFYSLTRTDHGTPSVQKHFPSSSVSADPLKTCFYSLAPTDNATRANSLDLFLWCLDKPDNREMKLISKFKNAHRTTYFGPIAETLSPKGDKYAAMVVFDSSWGSSYDNWQVAVVDFSNDGNYTQKELEPGFLSETVSVAGFGIPKEASIWNL